MYAGPVDVWCRSKESNTAVFDHPLGGVRDSGNYFQTAFGKHLVFLRRKPAPEAQYDSRSREFEDTAKRPVLEQPDEGPGKDSALEYPGGQEAKDKNEVASKVENGVEDSTSPEPSAAAREAYEQYISAYNKLTELMAAGKGDTPEAQEAYKKYKHYKDLYEASIGTGVGKITGEPAADEYPEPPDIKHTGGKVTTTGTGKEISASFTIPPRSGSYAWEHTKLLTIPGNGAVVFDAKATNDIHVCFAETASNRSPLYEVVIGGWNNTQTVIRKGRQTPHNGHARVNAKQNPQAMVAANRWATYWVSVNCGLVAIGRGKSVGQNIILTWQDPDPLQNLKTIAFSTWNTPVEYRNIRLRPVD